MPSLAVVKKDTKGSNNYQGQIERLDLGQFILPFPLSQIEQISDLPC